MNENLTNLRTTVETILRCDLAEAIGIADEAEAEAYIQRLLHAIGGNQPAPSALARFIDPNGLSWRQARVLAWTHQAV